MKVEAACLALASRVGATSVAIIEPETSIARMIVASSRGTATIADGRASATTSAAIGDQVERRRDVAPPGRRPRDEVREQVDVREADDVARPATLDEQVAERARAARASRPSRSIGSAKVMTPSPGVRSWAARLGSQLAGGREDDVADAQAPELAGDLGALGGGRRGEPLAQAARRRVDADLAAGLGIDERQLADVGQIALAGVVDLDGEDLVARGDGGQRSEPVARAAEVRDEHDEPAARRGRGDEPQRRTPATRSPSGSARRCQSTRRSPAARQRGQQAVAPDARRDAPVASDHRTSRSPSRLPRCVARWPTASATPSATSALRRSAVPNVIDGETSSSSQVVSARSGTWTRTCGTVVRAVTFQSMRRTSSPG